MTDIPTTAKEFEHWYWAHQFEWPAHLQISADRALLTLRSMRGKSFGKSRAFMDASSTDLKNFAADYAAFLQSKA